MRSTAFGASTASDAELLALLENGNWFLKHRKGGEKPHRRFVFTRGESIFWATREDRAGKLGQLDGPGLLCVPGAATVTFVGKKRLAEERRNKIFSIVGPSRTLDLEAESEAARHQWVRAFSAFAKRAATNAAVDIDPQASAVASALASGILGPTMEVASSLGVGVGAALGTDNSQALNEALDVADAVFSKLATTDTGELSSGAVRFPRLNASFHVLSGTGRWTIWELELSDGELRSAGRGCLPLRHVAALGLTVDGASESSTSNSHGLPGSTGAATSSTSSSSTGEDDTRPAELRLRLRLGSLEGARSHTHASRLACAPSASSSAPPAPSSSSSSSSAPDLRMRAPAMVARAWHSALSRSMALVEDLELARDSTLEVQKEVLATQLLPIQTVPLENELNRLFEGAFEGCANAAREALESLEPLMQACLAKLHTTADTLPPRSDLFGYYVEGMHRRFCNVYQTLLIRYDLDRSYLDTEGQQAAPSVGHREVLEPSLMLGMIGFNKRYEERMAAVGAGSGRLLLSAEASESLISAYLHACRQLTRQWATNIVFCEQQTMIVGKEDEASLLATVRGGGGLGDGWGGGGGPGAGGLTQGIITMSDDGGQQLWFTELHIDLFRIVHEHVELGINTGIEVVLFNVLLAAADFLVDVQNDLLARCRSHWRSLGFIYLCALVNNCRRCAELWVKVLENCSSERSPLSEAMANNLHLSFVSDGFVNLGFAAMQLAARRVLAQLEIPLGALFSGRPHHMDEMAALVDHFLQMVRDGVAGSHATRLCAITLELLLCTYGVMLLVQDAPLTPGTPALLSADLVILERLLATHCAAGPFASRIKAATRVRANALLALLGSLRDLLAQALTPGATATASMPNAREVMVRGGAAGAGGGDGGGGGGFSRTARQGMQPAASGGDSGGGGGGGCGGCAFDVDSFVEFTVQLWSQQPLVTREVLGRLIGKCGKAEPKLRGRKGTAVLDACEAVLARRRAKEVGGTSAAARSKSAADPATPSSKSTPQDAEKGEAAGATERFWRAVAVGLQLRQQLGKSNRISVLQLLELSDSRRRWD